MVGAGLPSPYGQMRVQIIMGFTIMSYVKKRIGFCPLPQGRNGKKMNFFLMKTD